MPCPYFEPQHAVADPTHVNARLPLIDEFAGLCHAGPEPSPVDVPRLRFCNHGNARGQCAHFPAAETRSAFRFNVLGRSAASLNVLFVEESLYAPVAWRSLTFTIDSGRLDPDPADACRRAQLLAFCRSYLRRYPA